MCQPSKYLMTEYRLSEEKIKRNLSHCLKITVKFPTKIIVWGALLMHGTSRLHIVDGTLTQDKYIRVLETRLMPQTR